MMRMACFQKAMSTSKRSCLASLCVPVPSLKTTQLAVFCIYEYGLVDL